jgi:hypothetical protein
MSITSTILFIGGFCLVSLSISILLVLLTRSKDILWPAWVLVTYNLGWDAIGVVLGIRRVHQEELRLFALLVGLVLGIALFIAVFKFFRLLRLERLSITRFDLWMLLLPTLVGFLGFAIGAIHSNDVGYLLSDTYKPLVLSGAYFVCMVNLRREASARAMFNILVALVLLQQVFDVVMVGMPLLSTGGYTRVADQFWINRLLLFPFLGLALARKTSMRNRVLYGFALMVTVAATLLSLYRTALILGVSSFFLVISPRTMLYFLKNLLIVVLIIAIATGFFISILQIYGQVDLVSQAWSFVFEKLSIRLYEMFEEGGVASIQVKLVEAQSVVDELLTRGSFLNWLAGFGSGAQYSADAKIQIAVGVQLYQQVYGPSELTHHIHNVFFAALLRYGLIGIVTLSALLLGIWCAVRKLDIRSRGRPDYIMMHTIFVYFIITLIVINLFSSFWGDANWGILTALSSIQGKARIRE